MNKKIERLEMKSADGAAAGVARLIRYLRCRGVAALRG